MKSESRVPKGYRPGSDDWKAEYNMLLDDGVICSDCVHTSKCCLIFGGNGTNTKCDFYPNRFRARLDLADGAGEGD